MFIRLVKICIDEMYLVFLIFFLNSKKDKERRREYYSRIFQRNIRGEYKKGILEGYMNSGVPC